MKITKLEIHILRAPDGGRPHWVSHFRVPKANEILVRMQTDQGVEGIGIATSYTPIEAAIHAVRTGIGELIVNADPLAPERLYERLFALTSQRLASYNPVGGAFFRVCHYVTSHLLILPL